MSMSSPPPVSRTRATIRDVAALAGVGIKTVSRVINNEANVSPQMRERVERAVSALNFKPNAGAGALRRGDGKTLTLGLLLDAVDNPFSAAINRAVEAVASARRTAVFAASSIDDPERERALIDAFARRRVDGLILTTITEDHGYLQVERDQGVPIVFIDRPPHGVLADAVVTDNEAAAERATQHLIDHGHRRIAHLGDDLAISTARDRQRGYAAAMTAAGLTGEHIPDIVSEQLGSTAVRELLERDEPPTAIFSSQNIVTIGALRALHALGRQHDIALVGFDDLPLSDLLQPGVTVMAQDPADIGRVAAEIIFRRLDGDDSPTSITVIPAHLIARGSGEIEPPAPPKRRRATRTAALA